MISSTQNTGNKQKRSIATPEQTETESSAKDGVLRPKKLSDYVGQERLKSHLSVSIESAKIRDEALEHALFYGPPGLGKTTIANIIAHEMDSQLRSTAGPAIEKQSDIVSILSNLQKGDILFIDEIHRLRPQIEEILYTAMEDFSIDIMVGSGTGAQSVKIPLQPFTLVGATTRLSALSSPLRDRFGNVLKLDFYKDEELALIVGTNAESLGFNLNEETKLALAKKARGTPRIANRLLKILRDYATIGKDINDELQRNLVFQAINIDELGLDMLDHKYLEILSKKGVGKPIGLGTLASMIGEEEATLEDVVEPFLMQIGFIERTPRGRVITITGKSHIDGNPLLNI